jgi:hypothetical protein
MEREVLMKYLRDCVMKLKKYNPNEDAKGVE